MAQIGLSHFRYAILESDNNGVATYGDVKTPGKAISCKVDVNNNDASLYADNALQESDTSFNNASITMGIDRNDLQMQADFLGHTIDESKKEITYNANDVANYIGFGRVITAMIDGSVTYSAKIICKAKFSDASEEDETKSDKLDFKTYEYSGTASTLSNGKWKIEKQGFTTDTDAIKYIEDYFKGTPASSSTTSGK